MSKANPLNLQPLIDFDSNNIGVVDKKKVIARMEVANLTHESFLDHDSFRDETFASAIQESIQHGIDIGVGGGDGVAISVDDIYLGGDTLGSIQISSEFKVVGAVTYKSGSLMDKVLSEGNDLFVKYNILSGSEEEELEIADVED